LVKYRIGRAKETLSEMEILFENEMWSIAVNRLYYACFYAINALLVQREIKAETHGGVRRMFRLHFIKELYAMLKTHRTLSTFGFCHH
jgi:uncharacterized protein